MKSAYKENGALMQLGHKYFSEMYHAKIHQKVTEKYLVLWRLMEMILFHDKI